MHDIHQLYTVDSQQTIINISNHNNLDLPFKRTTIATSTYTMLQDTQTIQQNARALLRLYMSI
jgi:hypothetical protein